jgi:hypothetical protein
MAMERYAAANSGTPLFVRPTCNGATWTPWTIERALLRNQALWFERFDNRA